jgi:glycosyltransferase involved in cell wall biosynthesis
MDERIIAVVPAYNEEKHIGKVLAPLLEAKRQGTVDDVIVVDDCSTDATAKAARAAGASVIAHERNMGKSEAVITAVRSLHERGADIIFLCDADMTDLSAEKARRFLTRIRDKPAINMIRAPYVQVEPGAAFYSFDGESPTLSMCQVGFSGFRAIRMGCLQPIISENSKWMGYLRGGNLQVDYALEMLVPPGGHIATLQWPPKAGRKFCDGFSSAMEAIGDDLLAERFRGAHLSTLNGEWRAYRGQEDKQTMVGGFKVEGGRLCVRADTNESGILPHFRTYPVRHTDGAIEVYGAAIRAVDGLELHSRRRGGGAVHGLRIQADMNAVAEKARGRSEQARRFWDERALVPRSGALLPEQEVEGLARDAPQPRRHDRKMKN